MAQWVTLDISCRYSIRGNGMVNLYEFLGIARGSTTDDVQAAIELAESDGKDASTIALCKKYILNSAMREKYDQALSIKQVDTKNPISISTYENTTPKVGYSTGSFGISDLVEPITRSQVRRLVEARQKVVQKLIDNGENPYQYNLNQSDKIDMHIASWSIEGQTKFYNLFAEEMSAMTATINDETDKLLVKTMQVEQIAWIVAIVIFLFILFVVIK